MKCPRLLALFASILLVSTTGCDEKTEPVKDAKYYAGKPEELKALLDVCQSKIEAVTKVADFEPLETDTTCQMASFAEAIINMGSYDKATIKASPEEFWRQKFDTKKKKMARWEAFQKEEWNVPPPDKSTYKDIYK